MSLPPPKYSVGDTLVVVKPERFAGRRIVVEEIEEIEETHFSPGVFGNYWYVYTTEEGMKGRWSEAKVRKETKLDKALR